MRLLLQHVDVRTGAQLDLNPNQDDRRANHQKKTEIRVPDDQPDPGRLIHNRRGLHRAAGPQLRHLVRLRLIFYFSAD